MKMLYIVFTICCLISCTEHLTLKEAIKSSCFWDITEDDKVIGGLNSCYQFLPDGRCYFYYYDFNNKKKTDSVFRFEDTDIIVSEKWFTIGDTTLVAREAQYKVLGFSKDTIQVIGYENDTLTFQKNCKPILKGPASKTQQ